MEKQQKLVNDNNISGMFNSTGDIGEKKSIKYVVVREDFRVSEREYDTPTDPECISEVQFWKNVSKNRSWGEKVNVVEYDSKKHRIW